MSVIASILAIVALTVWSGLFAFVYGMSAFDRQFSPMWFLAGSLPILAGALWLASRGGKRSAAVAAIVVGLAAQVTPGLYLGKEGIQVSGHGAQVKKREWSVTLVCSMAATVAMAAVGIGKTKNSAKAPLNHA